MSNSLPSVSSPSLHAIQTRKRKRDKETDWQKKMPGGGYPGQRCDMVKEASERCDDFGH